jgi:hypothetical protein
MVAWWSCVEGEMRSSNTDSETGGGELGEEEDDAEAEGPRGAHSRSGEREGGTGSAMRR